MVAKLGPDHRTTKITAGDLRYLVDDDADGVADAALFLAARLRAPDSSGRRLFDMIDVLKAGAMS